MRRALPLLLVLSALVGLVALPVLAVEAKLPRHPAPSPDGTAIAFSWQGDIWIVPAAGGAARRLTVHPAYDRFPVWSRDGKSIAFASDRYGNADVFVVAADGSSAPVRLTWASNGDIPVDFTPDGKSVIFASRRDEAVSRMPVLYVVPVTGGTAATWQSALGHSASIAPDGERAVFVRGGTPWTRRGYRGSANRELWVRETDGSYRRLAAFDGDDDAPTWTAADQVVFLSARNGRKNVFTVPADGSTAPRALTAHDGSDVRFPRAAANGSLVAYEFEDAIWTVAPAGGTPKKLTIDLPADARVNTLERKTAKDGASDMALSPDGKRIAFVVGGDVFVTAVRSKDDQEIAAPPTVRVTATPEREQDPAWSPDGKTLVFASARTGNLDLFAARRADDAKDWTESFEFPVTALTATPAHERAPEFSPDGKQLLFVRGRGELVVADADGGNARVLFTHFSAPQVAWSPDGKFIAYAQEDENANSEVFVLPLAGGEPYNVSRHPDNDLAPAWSPDGRRLIWLSRRHASTLDVWSVWLTRADDERTPEEWLKVWNDKPEPKKDDKDASEKEARKAADEKKGGKAMAGRRPGSPPRRKTKKLPAVTIDFERLWERAEPVTELKGDEGAPGFADGGKRIVFTAEVEAERDLYSVRWDGKDQKRLTTGGRAPSVIEPDEKGTTLFFLDGKGTLGRVALDGKAGDPLPFAARYEVDLPALRGAVVDEAWRALDENFYDPQFHGVDWPAQREKYRPWALAASTPEDFADVMNLMLDELNASHMGYRPQGGGPAGAVGGETTGFIGALFDAAAGGPGIRVREVLPDSPAARVDVALVPGDRILAVGGQKVRADQDVYALFADTVGQRVPLTILGADGKERAAVVIPVPFAQQQEWRRDAWVRQRRALVEQLSGGRLGYLYIPAMDMPSFEEFERDLYAAAHGREGLVIDVRNNGGGWTTDYLMAVLNVKRHAWTVERDASKEVKAYAQERLPLAAWTRPAVTVCNDESYSNAEIFSHAFKTLGRGKVVGWPTFGAVISTGGTQVLDGALVRLPTRGWYVAGTGVNMENNGAVPDVAVEQPPAQDMAAADDAQLAKAVEVLLADLPGDPRRGAW